MDPEDGEISFRVSCPVDDGAINKTIVLVAPQPITKEQMQLYANMKQEGNYCMVHEHIPTEHLPILYYVGDGPYMVLATQQS